MKKLFLAAAMLVAFSVATFAQPFGYGYGPKGKNMPAMRAQMAKALNLTDKQKEEIAKIKTEAQIKTVDLRSEIQKARLQIKEEMLKANPSKTTIKKLADKITELQGKIKDIHIDQAFKVYNLLDDNQKKIAKTRMLNFGAEARKGMMGKRRGFGRRHHGNFAPGWGAPCK